MRSFATIFCAWCACRHGPFVGALVLSHTTPDDNDGLTQLMCMKKKKILWAGDSSVMELFWEMAVLLSGTKPFTNGTNVTIPKACHRQACKDLCENSEELVKQDEEWRTSGHRTGVAKSWSRTKAEMRCSRLYEPECAKALLGGRSLNMDLLWTGTPSICGNGGVGLPGTVHSKPWLKMFADFTRGIHYDVVVFTAGAHDVKVNASAYADALEKMLRMLEPLATTRYFLKNPYQRNSSQIQRQRKILNSSKYKWRYFDRSPYHASDMHCAKHPQPVWPYPRHESCDRLLVALLKGECLGASGQGLLHPVKPFLPEQHTFAQPGWWNPFSGPR